MIEPSGGFWQAASGLGANIAAWASAPPMLVFAGDIILNYWIVLGWAAVFAALIIFISSVDDFFLDLFYWVLQLQRLITRPFRRVPTTAQVRDAEERRLAVMVPAWQESDVIARMLMNTLTTMEYSRYDIFVGCYPNDPATISEVDRIARQHANVHRAMVGHPGPTSKADCLNWMIQNILAHEKKAGVTYDAFIMQDSEDVIHPFSFKVMSWFLGRADMVQLPVLSMPRAWLDMIPCHYMDEFAEWHGKDLVARSHLTRLVPSAGVATGFSRRAITLLCEERDNQPFNTDSLTEDYDVGHRLFEAGLRSEFVRFYAKVAVGEVKRPHGRGMKTIYRRELICTREYFPDKSRISIRQKSRWMLGISFLGWRQLGWFGPASHRYFLYRDRKAIWTAPTGMLAYAIVAQWALYWLIKQAHPETSTLPHLIDPNSWVWVIVNINLLFLVSRLFHRLLFTGMAHGVRYALVAPVRMVIANYIGFMASARAARRFAWHLMSGQAITWDKTSHAYPSMSEIDASSNTLGQALKFWGAVNDAVLEDALAEQRKQYRPLGLLLLDRGDVTEEDLAAGFAEHAGLDRVDFDPLAVPEAIVGKFPRALAAQFAAFPIGEEKGALKIALAEPLAPQQKAALEAAYRKPLRYAISPISDVTFGIRFAYGRPDLDVDLRAARVLQRMGLADDDQIAEVWRLVRRRTARLGDVLVRRGMLDHDALQAQLPAFFAAGGEELGEFLVASGVIGRAHLDSALAAQTRPPFDFIRIARDAGVLSREAWEKVADAEPDLIQSAADAEPSAAPPPMPQPPAAKPAPVRTAELVEEGV